MLQNSNVSKLYKKKKRYNKNLIKTFVSHLGYRKVQVYIMNIKILISWQQNTK